MSDLILCMVPLLEWLYHALSDCCGCLCASSDGSFRHPMHWLSGLCSPRRRSL